MDIDIILNSLSLYQDGVWITLQLTFLSVTIGIVIAFILALAKNNPYRIISGSVNGFIYFFRGTPLLVQLYLIYYGIGQIEVIKDTFLWTFFSEPYLCALCALVLNTCAYGAEIIHGALKRTPEPEISAAIAYGMSEFQCYRRVIIPSAVRRALPAYFNEIVLMLHATSLVSMITIIDLTGVARIVNSKYYAPFEAFFTAGVIYLLLTFLLVITFRQIERRLNRHLV